MTNEPRFENRLERLLSDSADTPAARPEFYREPLQSQVLIIPHGAIEESDDPNKETATLRMASISHEGVA